MTSSWSLTARKQMTLPNGEKVWSLSRFGDTSNPYSGEEDHYITPGHTHECHPDYENIPIGNAYGFSVCRRKPKLPAPEIDPSMFNGYNKYKTSLYDPTREYPRQASNPEGFYTRRIPNEAFLHVNDYIARPLRYDGIGVSPLRTPGNRNYAEYGFDFTSEAPYKYDIQQLHQRYPVWKEARLHAGESRETLDKFDKEYTRINGMGTW